MVILCAHWEMMGYLQMETPASLRVMMVMVEMVLKKENADKGNGMAEMSLVLKVQVYDTTSTMLSFLYSTVLKYNVVQGHLQHVHIVAYYQNIFPCKDKEHNFCTNQSNMKMFFINRIDQNSLNYPCDGFFPLIILSSLQLGPTHQVTS